MKTTPTLTLLRDAICEHFGFDEMPDKDSIEYGYYESDIKTFTDGYQSSIQELVRRAGEVEISDQTIIDMVAIFNNPESPKIKCTECEGTGKLDIDYDEYPVRCDECEGFGYIQYAVNQTERIKQAREAIRPHLAPVASGWMPIGSAPRDGAFILCCHQSGYVNIMQYCTGGFWRTDLLDESHRVPTHWMPLPQPPKKD